MSYIFLPQYVNGAPLVMNQQRVIWPTPLPGMPLAYYSELTLAVCDQGVNNGKVAASVSYMGYVEGQPYLNEFNGP